MKFNYAWPGGSLTMPPTKERVNKSPKSEAAIEKKTDSSAPSNCSIKLKRLLELKEKKRQDKSLIFAGQATNFVFEDGNPDADLMFIGEAPGEEEDLRGLPFVGRSGQLLRAFLKEAGIKDFYITNIVSWRPPSNRTPTNSEILLMQPYIFEHIKIISPKIIVAVGTTSLKALNITQTITKAQNNLFTTDQGSVFPIYHPSYALRVSSKKKELWHSLLKLKNLLDG